MSQPANDEFSQHISDDEASNHEDASDTEEYDIWAMEMEHYLKYIDNDAWKVIQNGNSKKRISTGKGWLFEYFHQKHMKKIHGMDMQKKSRNIRTSLVVMQISKKMQKLFQQHKSSTNKVKSGFTGAYSTCTPSTSSTNIPEKEVLAGFADEVIYSLFAKQSEDWDLLHEDLEQN
ncbi:hypothetical protein Tco_0831262 [Tanacetum coccineum]